ncbi:MAG TPA: PAS domain S-box protein, partial [Bacillota bacterium]|nr:PAS domain S-box protein [Bacillota bacterium]
MMVKQKSIYWQWGRYLGAVIVVGGAFLLRLGLSGVFGSNLAYITFYPAVMLAAMLGGLGPGLLATGLATLLAWYWIHPPLGQFRIETPADVVGLAIFSGMGVIISLVAEFYQRARRKVATLEREAAVWASAERLRRETEAAVRASEKRLRTLVAATFEGIAISEGGRFQDVNEQLGRMLGYAREELVGVEVAAVIVPEDRSRVLANLQTGQESRLEHEMLRKDGTRITVEAHGQTVEFEGRCVRYTALRDITEQKRTERALRESEAKYRQLVDLMPTAVYACNCEGTIWFYNEQARALWGC